jgi:biopolymer transport protein ExbD
MAFTFGNGQSRSRFHGVSSMSEMNVVPLVDVVLVLLVIFMLTAHVMEFGLEVQVPKVQQVKDSAEELPVVTITRAGELYLNDKPVRLQSLPDEIRQRFGQQGQAVYVRADKDTIYDPIAQVIATLGDAKIDVRLVTQPVDEAEKRR